MRELSAGWHQGGPGACELCGAECGNRVLIDAAPESGVCVMTAHISARERTLEGGHIITHATRNGGVATMTEINDTLAAGTTC